jgi:hypothetical protein
MAVDAAYKTLSEKSLEETLESELSGDILAATKTIRKFEFIVIPYVICI